MSRKRGRGPKLLSLILRNFFSKPATIQYPFEPTPIEPDARGRHYADLSLCIGCSLCKIECPADAIVMKKIPGEYEVPKKNPRRLYPEINYFRCVYCYRCVTVCPVNAYVTTSEYRLASEKLFTSTELSFSTLKRGG